MTPRAGVFLDRDGTILREIDYLADPERVELEPGAARAIARLNAADLAVVVVTNQSGIARGLLDEARLAAVHARMAQRLAAEGARVDLVLHCPHHPEIGAPPWRGACACRKPLPGMIVEGARRLGLDLPRSWTVGDAERDLDAGLAAGTRAVLVATGKGAAAHRRLAAAGREHRFVPDLAAAVDLVLADATGPDIGRRARRGGL